MVDSTSKSLEKLGVNQVLESYGPDYEKKFEQLAKRTFCLSTSDVTHTAFMVYFDKIDEYDRSRPLAHFLWGALNGRLKRDDITRLKYAKSLDEEQVLKNIEVLAYEKFTSNNTMMDYDIEEISCSAELLELYDYAKSISGLSSSEIAAQANRTKRCINQQLKKKCERAEKLRKDLGL